MFSAGMILATGWNGADQPGWLYCDGRSLLTADYPVLYAAIAGRFGAADGTHFNIPDLRGRFLRGFDDATGRDPDAAGRTAMATGGATGDNVGSVQADAYKSHVHGLDELKYTGGGTSTILIQTTGSGVGVIQTTDASGGNETRPLNAGVAYYIKT